MGKETPDSQEAEPQQQEAVQETSEQKAAAEKAATEAEAARKAVATEREAAEAADAVADGDPGVDLEDGLAIIAVEENFSGLEPVIATVQNAIDSGQMGEWKKFEDAFEGQFTPDELKKVSEYMLPSTPQGIKVIEALGAELGENEELTADKFNTSLQILFRDLIDHGAKRARKAGDTEIANKLDAWATPFPGISEEDFKKATAKPEDEPEAQAPDTEEIDALQVTITSINSLLGNPELIKALDALPKFAAANQSHRDQFTETDRVKLDGYLEGERPAPSELATIMRKHLEPPASELVGKSELVIVNAYLKAAAKAFQEIEANAAEKHSDKELAGKIRGMSYEYPEITESDLQTARETAAAAKDKPKGRPGLGKLFHNIAKGMATDLVDSVMKPKETEKGDLIKMSGFDTKIKLFILQLVASFAGNEWYLEMDDVQKEVLEKNFGIIPVEGPDLFKFGEPTEPDFVPEGVEPIVVESEEEESQDADT